MPDMIGIMKWEEMEWRFPDFEETGLVYHQTEGQKLPSIFTQGLIPRFVDDPSEKHHTIYDALIRHRPAHIPKWVVPGHCVFAYMNMRGGRDAQSVQDGTITDVILGIKVDESIKIRTWTGVTHFSDWVYCPKEAGYLDTPEKKAFFQETIEPTCAVTYWTMSMSFEDNLKIRHDHLLPLQPGRGQGYHEVLICIDSIPPQLLSLQTVFIHDKEKRCRVIQREETPELFQTIEAKLSQGREMDEAFKNLLGYAAKPSSIETT